MIRIDFYKPLTALEIREPVVGTCRELAEERKLYVTFRQRQQEALSGHARSLKSQRERIGNGKHKDWQIYYQLEEPRVSKPTVVGKIALKSPYWPDKMQFGGFNYGKFGEQMPTYPYITIHTPSELEHFRPIDPDPELLNATYNALKSHFETNFPRLFEISDYTL